MLGGAHEFDIPHLFGGMRVLHFIVTCGQLASETTALLSLAHRADPMWRRERKREIGSDTEVMWGTKDWSTVIV